MKVFSHALLHNTIQNLVSEALASGEHFCIHGHGL